MVLFRWMGCGCKMVNAGPRMIINLTWFNGLRGHGGILVIVETTKWNGVCYSWTWQTVSGAWHCSSVNSCNRKNSNSQNTIWKGMLESFRVCSTVHHQQHQKIAQKNESNIPPEPLNNTHAQYNIHFQWIMLSRKNKIKTCSCINFQLNISFKILNHF